MSTNTDAGDLACSDFCIAAALPGPASCLVPAEATTVADLEAVKARLGGLQRLTESMPGGQLTEGFLKSWYVSACGVDPSIASA